MYIMLDFIYNIYDYGICDDLRAENTYLSLKELQRRLPYFIAYKVISSVPLCFLSAYIAISFIYRTFDCYCQLKSKKLTAESRKFLEFENRDNCFCTFCNVKDDNEVIFSKCDLMYVIDLLKPTQIEGSSANKDIRTLDKKDLKNMNDASYFKVKPKHESKVATLFRRYVYDWNPNFRFTSRFINTMVVAFLALFFFFMNILYTLTMFVTYLAPKQLSSLVNVDNSTLNIGKILSSLFIDDDEYAINFSVKIPNQIAKFLPQFRSSLIALFVAPILGSMVICIIQFFLLIRESQIFMLEMYKGKCEFVKNKKSINNGSVFSNSFLFGG